MEEHLYINLSKLKSSDIQDVHFKLNSLCLVDDQTEEVDDKKYQIFCKNSHDKGTV